MSAYRNRLLQSATAALLWLSAGCAHHTHLRSPRNLDRLEVGGEASPRFTWRSSYRIARPGDYHEYTLVVARDEEFRNIVFEKDRLESETFVIDPEEAWLTGDREYFWRVDGVVRDENAAERRMLPCERPRSFRLEMRRTVEVSLTVPDGFEARIGGAGGEFSEGTFSVALENGERREVVLRSTDGKVVISGQVRVVAVNDDTRYARIIIDNIKPAELESIARGDVGVYHFELGGRRIVELKLGSRSRMRDDRGAANP